MDYKASEYLIPVFDYGVLHLELNTALFILVLFGIVVFALNGLLFRPVLRSLDNRTALVEGIQSDNAAKEAEIERLAEEYRANLDRVREEVAQFRQENRRAASLEAESILAVARETTERELEAALATLETEMAGLRREALGNVERIAQQITQRVLER